MTVPILTGQPIGDTDFGIRLYPPPTGHLVVSERDVPMRISFKSQIERDWDKIAREAVENNHPRTGANRYRGE